MMRKFKSNFDKEVAEHDIIRERIERQMVDLNITSVAERLSNSFDKSEQETFFKDIDAETFYKATKIAQNILLNECIFRNDANLFLEAIKKVLKLIIDGENIGIGKVCQICLNKEKCGI